MNNLIFDSTKYTIKTMEMEDQLLRYRAFENIVYVKNPVDIAYQSMNIYVPEEFYKGRTVNGYDLQNAPIFFPNTVGGYMPGLPEGPGINWNGAINATFHALIHGYVVACAGARGRRMKDENGRNIGVAPADIVDLKAAVRYLKYNKGRIPGDPEKIISNGTSAGGAMSSLLGSTGNHPDYLPYLEEIGAADTDDSIFAASCYCPITNLDHADMAYEWEFGGHNEYHTMNYDAPVPAPVTGWMNEKQIILSKQLKAMFPAYLNSLGLKDGETDLVLNEDGNGSFKEFVIRQVYNSVQKELDRGSDLAEYNISGKAVTGNGSEEKRWFAAENGKVISINWDKYIQYRTRMKDTPAFDDVFKATAETELFGTADKDNCHFTVFSHKNSETGWSLADEQIVKMMNPMNYIQDARAQKASNYRIRHGAVDRDTSLAISAILTAALRMEGIDVDYQLPWGIPHAGDYDISELFEWIDSIC